MSTDIEAESFNDLHNRRLAALARTLGPVGQAEVETIIAQRSKPESGVPVGITPLLGEVSRLTFGDMMILAEGILGNPPPTEPLKPFDLATRLWNFAASMRE